MKQRQGVLFYVLAVIFLLITVLVAFNSYQSLALNASSYGVSLSDEWFTVIITLISSSFGYLGFAFIFYGIALILNKIDQKDDTETKKNKKK